MGCINFNLPRTLEKQSSSSSFPSPKGTGGCRGKLVGNTSWGNNRVSGKLEKRVKSLHLRLLRLSVFQSARYVPIVSMAAAHILLMSLLMKTNSSFCEIDKYVSGEMSRLTVCWFRHSSFVLFWISKYFVIHFCVKISNIL